VTDNAEAGNGESLDYESRTLVQFCQSNNLLLTSYQLLLQLNSSLPDSMDLNSGESVKDVREICVYFHINDMIITGQCHITIIEQIYNFIQNLLVLLLLL